MNDYSSYTNLFFARCSHCMVVWIKSVHVVVVLATSYVPPSVSKLVQLHSSPFQYPWLLTYYIYDSNSSNSIVVFWSCDPCSNTYLFNIGSGTCSNCLFVIQIQRIVGLILVLALVGLIWVLDYKKHGLFYQKINKNFICNNEKDYKFIFHKSISTNSKIDSNTFKMWLVVILTSGPMAHLT